MADRFYSMVLGESQPHQVTEGASTSSEAIELRIADTVYSRKAEVLNAVQGILNYLKVKENNPIS
jgi:hypothetical protein